MNTGRHPGYLQGAGAGALYILQSYQRYFHFDSSAGLSGGVQSSCVLLTITVLEHGTALAEARYSQKTTSKPNTALC